MTNLVLYILILLALFKFLFPLLGKQLEKRDLKQGKKIVPYRQKALYWGLIIIIVAIYTILFPTHIKPQPNTQKMARIEHKNLQPVEPFNDIRNNADSNKPSLQMRSQEQSTPKKWKEQYNLQSDPKD